MDFATAGTAIFAHYQIRSKTTKIAKKLQKWAFLVDLSVSAKYFGAKLTVTDRRLYHNNDSLPAIVDTCTTVPYQ